MRVRKPCEPRDIHQWLIDRLSRPAERKLERKALVLIERIAGDRNESDPDDYDWAEVYRSSHAALGICGRHTSWVNDIKKRYAAIRKRELRQKKYLVGKYHD